MKTIVKYFIPADSFVYRLIRKVYHLKLWIPKDWKTDMLQGYANYNPNAKFIQIGSNNGISADPINKLIVENNWHGVLIEPIKYLFEDLKRNYSAVQSRLIFENCAIGTTNGEVSFYRMKKSDLPDLPYWYDQIGSFNKDVVMKHANRIPHFSELFMEEKVSTITLRDLLSKHSISRIDLIQIDTEGYDFEILKMIPFGQMKIDFIMFENKHLKKSDFKKAIKMLKKNGYKIGLQYKDTIAVRKEILPLIKEANRKEYKQAFEHALQKSVRFAH